MKLIFQYSFAIYDARKYLTEKEISLLREKK